MKDFGNEFQSKNEAKKFLLIAVATYGGAGDMNTSVIVVIVAIVVDCLSFLSTRSHIELMSLLSCVFLAIRDFVSFPMAWRSLSARSARRNARAQLLSLRPHSEAHATLPQNNVKLQTCRRQRLLRRLLH